MVQRHPERQVLGRLGDHGADSGCRRGLCRRYGAAARRRGNAVTVLVIILFGKPSAGGANGVPFLLGFWLAIGPYLPPRNAYVLLKNTVYFGGNGTSQALIILLAYSCSP